MAPPPHWASPGTAAGGQQDGARKAGRGARGSGGHRQGREGGVGGDTHCSGNSVAYWIFWVKEKLSQPALEQMLFMPAVLEKL